MAGPRFNVKGLGESRSMLPVEAITHELCETKNATENLLARVTEMKEETSQNTDILRDILTAVQENSTKVSECIEQMVEAIEQMKISSDKIADRSSEVCDQMMEIKDEMRRENDRGVQA